jgi:AcrR family transcriptional regulator
MPPTKVQQPRKKPSQARSRATVDALLDATARVLVKQGYAAASTNRIAEMAGISVGSLYQYFPSKDALVTAVRRRHASEMSAMLRGRAATLAGAPLETAVEILVHAVVEAHLIDPKLHRVLDEQVPRPVTLSGGEDIGDDIRATLKMLLTVYRDQILPTDLDLASMILLHTVEALIHAALDESKPESSVEAIEREIKLIVLRYLKPS